MNKRSFSIYSTPGRWRILLHICLKKCFSETPSTSSPAVIRGELEEVLFIFHGRQPSHWALSCQTRLCGWTPHAFGGHPDLSEPLRPSEMKVIAVNARIRRYHKIRVLSLSAASCPILSTRPSSLSSEWSATAFYPFPCCPRAHHPLPQAPRETVLRIFSI